MFKGIKEPIKAASGVAGTAGFVQKLVEMACLLLREIWMLHLVLFWLMPGPLYSVSNAFNVSTCIFNAFLPQWHRATTLGYHLSFTE